ncbi:MAG: hypothetical protein ABIZ04_13440 [Opitutus sp.]
MKPVIQRDRTGCAIASVAALTHQSYPAVKKAATELGIAVADPRLWSTTAPMRRLLDHYGLANTNPRKFASWALLPTRALLAIKWHEESTGAAWHWVVFARDATGSYVLDSKKSLRSHRRTDFGRIKPKWFIHLPE